MLKYFIFNKVPTNSPLTYFFLAFITMAGLSYINFLPGVVSALAGGIGFNDVEAGQIVALNGYGGIAGSAAAIFLVRRIHWRPTMLSFLALLAVIDLSTLWVDDYSIMLGWRFLAGIVGGLNMGIALSVLARLNNPDRAFGTLLFIQFSVGSLVIYLLPALETILSAYAVFCVMASFAILSVLFLLFIPAIPIGRDSISQATFTPALSGLILLLLLAILSYQIAASAIWAYVGLIGLGADISNEKVSLYIATTGLLGLAGAMLPIICGKGFGRLYWLSIGITLSIFSTLLLVWLPFSSQFIVPLYLVSMGLLFFSWPAIQSYLFALTPELDSYGRLSTIAGLVSSLGLASGPLLASSLVDKGNFSMMLYCCAAIFLLSFLLLLKPVRTQEKVRHIVQSRNKPASFGA